MQVSNNSSINDVKAYLFGLLCGRGHIYLENLKIIIEFSHKNPTISGIAHCHKCGWLATEKKDNNPHKDLYCKNCLTIVPKSSKKVYEQKSSTINSIKNVIIPFLKKEFVNCLFDISGNDHMTFLIIDFSNSRDSLIYFYTNLNQKTGFDSFEIPDIITASNKNCKTEFINGLLDTAGFFNSGGWLNRPGQNGEGRMRGYFQVVRNWKMPVQICNLLKIHFKLPIHTIDWGHPNIRDSNMEDYYESNPLSWSREHQVKFFPEYYDIFTIRINHKKQMFDELKEHNIKVGFSENDDCTPPKSITLNKVKPFHPGENDKRLPSSIRKHHDSFCQVCSNLGCHFMNMKLEESENPEMLYLTGNVDSATYELKKGEYYEKSKSLAEAIHLKKSKKLKDKINKLNTRIRTNPEQKLYEPLTIYYQKFLNKKYKSNSLVHDTSAFYLDKFILQNDLVDDFEFCNEFKIKPDIVGFLKDIKKIAFMEVKANELSLKDLGQLLGYCLVAQPIEAILVSPEKPSLSLIKILKTNSNLLQYSEDKKIEIATWINDKLEFINY